MVHIDGHRKRLDFLVDSHLEVTTNCKQQYYLNMFGLGRDSSRLHLTQQSGLRSCVVQEVSTGQVST